jgi:putative peptide zinc metalloprotease protein
VTPPLGTPAPSNPLAPTTGRGSDGPPGRAPQNGQAASAPAAPPRPARAQGVQLIGEMAGSGYRRPPSLVRRADGQTLQLTPMLYQVLCAMDGERTYADVAEVVSQRIGKLATARDILFLSESKLRPLGLVRGLDGSEPETQKASPLLGLRCKLAVTNPDVTRRITAPFAALFHPLVAIPMIAAFAAATVWLMFEKGLASATHEAFYEPGLLLLVFLLTVLSAGFHEFGHAAACRYGGATPGGMGVGLYLVWPVFYTEVTDSYRLGRIGRLRVDLGGLYFNAVFAMAMLGVWALVRWDALLLVIGAQVLQMVRQLAPLVRFDGYHILADLIGVPDLFAHIKPTLLGLLPHRWGAPETKVLKGWARAVVTLWVLAVVPLLAFFFGLMVKVLPRLAVTAWDSLGRQWAAFGVNWADGDLYGVGVRLLSVLAICIPVLSTAYLIVRIVRRVVVGVLRMTAGKPALRAVAAAGAALLLALVAWVWWTDGEPQPIRHDEPGTVPDIMTFGSAQPEIPLQIQQALASSHLQLPGGRTVARPQPVLLLIPRTEAGGPQPVAYGIPLAGDGEGFTGEALPPTFATAPDAGPAGEDTSPESAPAPAPAATPAPTPTPTESSAPTPAEAGGLPGDAQAGAGTPGLTGPFPEEHAIQVWEGGTETAPDASGGEAPATEPTDPAPEGEWAFPWNPPREPLEGDNQAVAINTQDGSTLYDVAFALVWVGDEWVEERNEAYAFASCRDCKTVAVAFQVILIVGDSNVIVPVNLAVAANYACESCVTHAVAMQLVATLTGVPSEEVLDELTRVWSRLDHLEEDIANLSLEEIYAELATVEREILEVLLQGDPATSAETAHEEDRASGEDGALEGGSAPDDDEPTEESVLDPASTEESPGLTPEAELLLTLTGEDLAAPAGAPVPAPSSEPTAVADGPAPVPTSEPAPAPTSEPVPTAEPTATSEPAATPTSEPTATAEPAPTATAEPAPTATAEPAPTATAEPAPTSEPSPIATSEPAPSATEEPSS